MMMSKDISFYHYNFYELQFLLLKTSNAINGLKYTGFFNFVDELSMHQERSERRLQIISNSGLQKQLWVIGMNFSRVSAV